MELISFELNHFEHTHYSTERYMTIVFFCPLTSKLIIPELNNLFLCSWNSFE